MPTANLAEYARLLASPVDFARGVLGHDLWPMQAMILEAVAESDSVAVKSCHASGKTFTAAAAVLWWLSRWSDGVAVTTAPTWTQVERVLWGELRHAWGSGRFRLPGDLLQTELRIGPGNYAIGLSTNEGVRFQGFHGPHVLLVLDEAPGVRADIWQAIEGIRAGGEVHVLAIGNPTTTSGPFFEAFHGQRGRWRTLTISAFDTPNLAGLSVPSLLALPEHELAAAERPYLVTRHWAREKHAEWGPDSDLWRVRVLGEFPGQGSDSLIPLVWVEAAETVTLPPGGLLEAGLDVARQGEDSSALCLREGGRVLGEWEWHLPDLMQVVGQVNVSLAPHRERLHALKVDVLGMGYGVADRLREQGWPVVEVDVAAPSVGAAGPRFLNLRAQYWWEVRELLRQGLLAGPLDGRTQAELVSIRYALDSSGRVAVEKKEDARKRGVPSPNRADALMLAFSASVASGAFRPRRKDDAWGRSSGEMAGARR